MKIMLRLTTICGLKESLICCRSSPHSIVSAQGNHFTASNVAMCPCSWNLLVLPVSQLYLNIIERMAKWPFEDQFTMPSMPQYLAWLGQCAQGGCVCCKPTSNIWCWSLHNQDSQVQERTSGTAPLIIASRNLRTKYLLPVHHNLKLCCYRGQREKCFH